MRSSERAFVGALLVTLGLPRTALPSSRSDVLQLHNQSDSVLLERVVTAECAAGREDCTEQLQAALISAGAHTVVIPANRAVWPTRPLTM